MKGNLIQVFQKENICMTLFCPKHTLWIILLLGFKRSLLPRLDIVWFLSDYLTSHCETYGMSRKMTFFKEAHHSVFWGHKSAAINLFF